MLDQGSIGSDQRVLNALERRSYITVLPYEGLQLTWEPGEDGPAPDAMVGVVRISGLGQGSGQPRRDSGDWPVGIVAKCQSFTIFPHQCSATRPSRTR